MNKIFIVLFLALMPAANVLAEPNPNDSLLFDGESHLRTETYYCKTGDKCEFRDMRNKGEIGIEG